MSEDDQTSGASSSSRSLTAEYRDGSLQIVEVSSLGSHRFDDEQKQLTDTGVELKLSAGSSAQQNARYLPEEDKGVIQLLNLTLVRCEDGAESYKLVTNNDSDGSGEPPSDDTVTCVLHSSDGEEGDTRDAYVVVDGAKYPVVFLSDAKPEAQRLSEQTYKKSVPLRGSEEIDTESLLKKPVLSPVEILLKAKLLQKATALVTPARGHKRKGELPSPQELLASPNFKLYLYSCKMCSFKCNAIKELTEHKVSEHSGGRHRGRATGSPPLQCARCPFKGSSHTQLMKHVQEHRTEKASPSLPEPDSRTQEVENENVIVCGACGFEAKSRAAFRTHIVDKHTLPTQAPS